MHDVASPLSDVWPLAGVYDTGRGLLLNKGAPKATGLLLVTCVVLPHDARAAMHQAMHVSLVHAMHQAMHMPLVHAPGYACVSSPCSRLHFHAGRDLTCIRS